MDFHSRFSKHHHITKFGSWLMACKGYRVFHYSCGQCRAAGYSVCKAVPNNSNIPKNTLSSVQEGDAILVDIKFLLLILFLFSKQRVGCWAVLILKVHTLQTWKRALLPAFQGTCNYGGSGSSKQAFSSLWFRQKIFQAQRRLAPHGHWPQEIKCHLVRRVVASLKSNILANKS